MINQENKVVPMQTQTPNIFQRINYVMQEVSYIQKSAKKVNNQYTYVSHDQVSSTLHAPLTRHGIALINSVVELIQDGTRTIAKVEVTFINIDDPSDRFSVISYGYGIDAADKGPGKAISYACKYALLKTFCLETGDDPDHDQSPQNKYRTKEEVEQDLQKKLKDKQKNEKPTQKNEQLNEKQLEAQFYNMIPQDELKLWNEYIAHIILIKKNKMNRVEVLSRLISTFESSCEHFTTWKQNRTKPEN